MGDINTFRDKIREYVKERDWEQFHNPKDLGIALSIEVSELLEHFRFKTNDEIKKHLENKENKKEISHELADILFFLTRLADVMDIDLVDALNEKMEISVKRYPVDKVKGKSHKYTHYER